MAPRSALLVLGIQNEFLDFGIGRCTVVPTEPGKQSFVEIIRSFIPNFRTNGGDVIWVRSEYHKPRDFIDPRNDETVLIINADDNSSDSEPELNDNKDNTDGSVRPRAGFSLEKPKLMNGARPPLRTDAFLAVESQHPPCKPGTPASEFHHSVVSAIVSPPDRVLVKTWFSAFKETNLLETLRGRFVSELYICGVLTNICVLATAADAAKHGFNVYVLQDCLGYRNRIAHQQALRVMVDDYGVQEVRSGLLIKSWERQRLKKGDSDTGDNGSAGIQLGATNISKEQLVAMVEGLKVGGDNKSAKTGKPPELVKEDTKNQEGAPASPDNIAPPTVVDPLTTISREDENLLNKAAEVGGDQREKLVQQKQEADVVKKDSVCERNNGEGEEGGKSKGGEKDERNYREHRKKASNSKRGRPNPSPQSGASGSTKPNSKSPAMGEDTLGEGDTMLVRNILPESLSRMAFEKLKKEVSWRTMYHRGGEVPRMVAVEGVVNDDGSFPIYRHPADESPPLLPFSPTVQFIVENVQKILKHPVNHVLIQHYRDGNDYISEHSDKTLDIVRGSKIVNVSLGAQRTMILRTKKDAAKEQAAKLTPREQAQRQESAGPERTIQRIPLPHNSMFVLGLETNRRWLHGIRQDRRLPTLKTTEEVSYNGERISLTFRHIGTFLSANEKEIWGQGAVSKSKDDPRPVINGDDPDTERLIRAFGSENHQSDFDWDASYGTGFDVLHFVPQLPKLFFIRGDVHSDQVRMCLAEKGIEFKSNEMEPDEINLLSYRAVNPRGTTPVLIDIDREKTIVCESLPIMQYLEMFYPSKDTGKFLLPPLTDERAAVAKVLQRLQESERLHRILETDDKRAIETELEIWNGYLLRTQAYILGNYITLADIAVLPVLEHYIRRTGSDLQRRWDALLAWRSSMVHRKSAKLLFDAPEGGEETNLTEDLEKTMAGLKLQPQ